MRLGFLCATLCMVASGDTFTLHPAVMGRSSWVRFAVEDRFAIEDLVECNLGDRWARGAVVDLMYKGADMASSVAAPYQVKLEQGALIYVPSDSNEVIRKPRRLFNLL